MNAWLPSPRRLRTFVADASGIAAVEMAFIAPIALILLSLGVASGQSLTTYHKVVLAAHSVTDLVSRTVWLPDPNTANAELLTQSDLDADLALSQMILYPASTTNLKVVMSELKITGNSTTATVVWSEGFNGGVKLAVGTNVILDANLVAAGAPYILYGQVTYNFQPFGGILSLPSISLSSTETLTIRNASQITVNWGS